MSNALFLSREETSCFGIHGGNLFSQLSAEVGIGNENPKLPSANPVFKGVSLVWDHRAMSTFNRQPKANGFGHCSIGSVFFEGQPLFLGFSREATMKKHKFVDIRYLSYNLRRLLLGASSEVTEWGHHAAEPQMGLKEVGL